MRKASLRILFALLLVFAQLGALVHEIGHQGSSVALQRSGPTDSPADPLCSLCLAFAQLAAFAQPLAPVLPVLAVASLLRATPLPAGRSVSVAHGRNRDPPALA